MDPLLGLLLDQSRISIHFHGSVICRKLGIHILTPTIILHSGSVNGSGSYKIHIRINSPERNPSEEKRTDERNPSES